MFPNPRVLRRLSSNPAFLLDFNQAEPPPKTSAAKRWHCGVSASCATLTPRALQEAKLLQNSLAARPQKNARISIDKYIQYIKMPTSFSKSHEVE